MPFQLSLPQQLVEAERLYVTLALSGDTVLPTVEGQWERDEGGAIEAWYTRPQLCEAVLAGLAIEIGQMQTRLERGEKLIIEARRRSDGREVVELEQHWIAMLERITRLLDAQAVAQIGSEKR